MPGILPQPKKHDRTRQEGPKAFQWLLTSPHTPFPTDMVVGRRALCPCHGNLLQCCAPSRGEEASWELPRDQDCFDFVEANVLPQQLPHMLQGLHWFSMNQINQHYPRGLAHCFPLPLVLTAQQRHSSFCFSLQCIWGAGWYLDLISSGFLLFSEWSFIFLSFGSYFFLLFKSAWSHDRLLA